MIQRIYIFGNPTQSEGTEHIGRFFNALAAAATHTRLMVEPDYMQFLLARFPHLIHSLIPFSEPADSSQPALALSVGGDGTFLNTANRIIPANIPIMGINSGHLGYLSATDINRAPEVAESIIAGHYRVEPRTLLQVSSTSPLLPSKPFALNEVVILKQDTASMITVNALLNDLPLASYSGDGLIISTPTGSTGYNMSVGGPIVGPHSADWIISPVAPHSLSMRPLVVNDNSVLTVTARSRTHKMLLAIDGRSTPLPIDTSLTIKKAPFCVNLALLAESNFIDTLRHKLHWG